MGGDDKVKNRKKSVSSTPKATSQQQKRPRASSGGTDDDPEVLLDSLLGALSDTATMERFVLSLCNIPDLKAKLVEFLLPTLELQVKQILEPLKSTVTELENKLKTSNERCAELEKKHDDLEQYTRRHNVRISGIPEVENENTDDLIVSFARTKLGVSFKKDEIDRSHRVGKKSEQSTRDIIVRFVSYQSKVKFMKSKKKLKKYNKDHKSTHYISEDLTQKRSKLAYEARKLKRKGIIKDTWTYDGKIFTKSHEDAVTIYTEISNLPKCEVSTEDHSTDGETMDLTQHE